MELTQMRAVWDHKREQAYTKRKALQDKPNKPESEVSKYLNRNETQNFDPLKWYVWKWSNLSKSRWFNKNIFINQSKKMFNGRHHCQITQKTIIICRYRSYSTFEQKTVTKLLIMVSVTM